MIVAGGIKRWLGYFALVLVIVFLVVLLGPRGAADNGEAANVQIDDLVLPSLPPELASVPTIGARPTNPDLRVKSAVLIDSDSGVVLFSESPQIEIPIASTTKLMTAILVRANLDLNQVVTISAEQASINGSKILLRSGEKMTVRSLLTGLLVASGNDAAMALAEAVGGSVEKFVEMMNQLADEWDLTHTKFADPAGLEDSGQSTAFELSVIARAALIDPVIAEIVRIPETTIYSMDGRIAHDLKNSNRLVNEFAYLGAIGVKTGFTPEAGHCLVAAAERDGHRLIAVVLHTDADTITASAIEARKLLDWGWQNVDWQI